MDRTDPIQKALDEAKGDMEAAEPLNGDDEDEDDGMPKDAQGILDRIKMIGGLITKVSIINKYGTSFQVHVG